METEWCSTESSLGQGRNKEIKNFLEFNKNKYTTYPNIWDTMKAILMGRFIAINAYIRKSEKSHINDLTEHSEALEQK